MVTPVVVARGIIEVSRFTDVDSVIMKINYNFYRDCRAMPHLLSKSNLSFVRVEHIRF